MNPLKHGIVTITIVVCFDYFHISAEFEVNLPCLEEINFINPDGAVMLEPIR